MRRCEFIYIIFKVRNRFFTVMLESEICSRGTSVKARHTHMATAPGPSPPENLTAPSLSLSFPRSALSLRSPPCVPGARDCARGQT